MQATLWALDVETGETLWETKLGKAAKMWHIAIGNIYLFLGC